MLPISSALQREFEEYLRKNVIPEGLQGLHKKWLRSYLDFSRKYDLPAAQRDSLPPFMQKLQEKKQTRVQQEQAERAVTLYYEILRAKNPSNREPLIQAGSPQRYADSRRLGGSPVRERAGKSVQYEEAIPPVARFSGSSATASGLS